MPDTHPDAEDVAAQAPAGGLHPASARSVRIGRRNELLELSAGNPTTTATFSQPGTYVLRAYADDSVLTTTTDVTVVVNAPLVR